MERFRPDGHLTDQALAALIGGEDAGELGQLELAEHLAFCDLCLQRYTDLLSAAPLLTPVHSCQETLWARIRARTVRMLTSRYATAAAAVALALTILWGGAGLRGQLPQRPELLDQAGSAVTEHIRSWPERWSRSLDGAVSGLNEFFDSLGRQAPTEQGGTK